MSLIRKHVYSGVQAWACLALVENTYTAYLVPMKLPTLKYRRYRARGI